MGIRIKPASNLSPNSYSKEVFLFWQTDLHVAFSLAAMAGDLDSFKLSNFSTLTWRELIVRERAFLSEKRLMVLKGAPG